MATKVLWLWFVVCRARQLVGVMPHPHPHWPRVLSWPSMLVTLFMSCSSVTICGPFSRLRTCLEVHVFVCSFLNIYIYIYIRVPPF